MILTCPECASRYFVDDALVGPNGRQVRCTNCGRSWRAGLKSPAPLPTNEFVDDLIAEPIAAAPAPEAPIVAPLAPLKKKAKAKAAKDGKGLASALVWGALAVVLLMILAAAVLLRVDIVRLAPRTASAYAAIGLPVNSVGLVIESLRAQPAMRDGHAALTVTGVLRNVEGHEVMAPPLRVSLLNPAGRRVAEKIAAAVDPLIPAGETRHFAVDLIDPPSTARDLEITFVVAGAPTATAKAPAVAAGHAPTRAGEPDPAPAQAAPSEAHPPAAADRTPLRPL